MCHEYGWQIEYTLARPLAVAFALYAQISLRHGARLAGPSYAEQALIALLTSQAK